MPQPAPLDGRLASRLPKFRNWLLLSDAISLGNLYANSVGLGLVTEADRLRFTEQLEGLWTEGKTAPQSREADDCRLACELMLVCLRGAMELADEGKDEGKDKVIKRLEENDLLLCLAVIRNVAVHMKPLPPLLIRR